MSRVLLFVACMAIIAGCSKSPPDGWGSVHWRDSADHVKMAYPDAQAITFRYSLGRLSDCSTEHAMPGYERITTIGSQKFLTIFCFDDMGLRSVQMKMIDAVSLAPSPDDPLLRYLISEYGKPSKGDDGIDKLASFGWYGKKTNIILIVIRLVPGDTQVKLTFIDDSAKVKPPP